jgi:hypothetical protein
MPIETDVDNGKVRVENHLLEKRDELIWALSLQGYTSSQIGRIFNIRYRSTVTRIIKKKPSRWTPKWVKRSESEDITSNG